VGLAHKKPLLGQPENCLIERSPWQLLERPAKTSALGVLQEAVQGGDLTFGSASDRVAACQFATQPALASLALVPPSDVRWLFETIGSKQRVRARFRLGANHIIVAN
jgi:hypothetical protein